MLRLEAGSSTWTTQGLAVYPVWGCEERGGRGWGCGFCKISKTEEIRVAEKVRDRDLLLLLEEATMMQRALS